MTSKGQRNTTAAEARRQTTAVQRITGEWYCQSGAHWTKGEQFTWRTRRICSPCKTRLQVITQKQATR